MGQKYSKEEIAKYIKGYYEKKEKDPEYSRHKYSREKGIAESTFRLWLTNDAIKKKNEVVCIETKATTQEETCDTSIPKITIKTGKVILTIENGITKEILSFLERMVKNDN